MSSSLEGVYRFHHEIDRAPFFVLCGDERSSFLKKHIGKGKKVLDIGCRDGALASHYAQDNEVWGVDIDSESLERAHQNFGIKAINLDLNGPWGLPENFFDFVVAAEVLEHLYYPNQVLEKINQVLKPGGVIIGSIPNAFSLMNRLRYLFGRKKNTPLSDPTHINHFSRSELKRLLADHFCSCSLYSLGRFRMLARISPSFFAFIIMFTAKK